MVEKGTLFVLAANFALFVRLSVMPEVRRVLKIVGEKEVDLLISPQDIKAFYAHTQNHSICNDFFYRRLLICWSYCLCLLLTIMSILILGGASLFSESQASSQPASVHASQPHMKQIKDLDLSTVKAGTILSIRADATYSMVDVSDGAEVLLVDSGGKVLKPFSGKNILFASIFFAMLGGILCLVLAGPLKKTE